MTKALEVRGLDDLARLSHALREVGEQGKGLKRQLAKDLTKETKQTRKDMRAAILPGLPQAGGLARDVQSTTRFTTTTSTGASTLGVRIKARGRRSIRRMNATGTFRHPVFGNRNLWVSQSAGVRKGFLDEPFEKSRTALQRAVMAAISNISAQLYRKV